MNLESLSPYILFGLLVLLCLLGSGIMLGAARRQKQSESRLMEQRLEEQELQRKEKQQEEDRIIRLKDSIKKSAWINPTADYVLQIKDPLSRVEIWKNQLITEGEAFNLIPLSVFGEEVELTTEETYYANRVLYEILCGRGCLQFRLRDEISYCEIIKL